MKGYIWVVNFDLIAGSVQIADFGVSGSVIEQLRTTLCGSPCWMAPEVMKRAWPQNKQEVGYDSSVDVSISSLAIVTLTAMTQCRYGRLE